jgi:hypothetical protein
MLFIHRSIDEDKLPPVANIELFHKATCFGFDELIATTISRKQFRPARTEYRPRFELIKHSFVIFKKRGSNQLCFFPGPKGDGSNFCRLRMNPSRGAKLCGWPSGNRTTSSWNS